MSSTMQYRGYTGSVEFSESDALFYGKVQGIRSLISYEGSTAQDLIEDFHVAVDQYLAYCADNHQEPEKAYMGNFRVQISPELHKLIAEYAAQKQMPLNSLVEKALFAYKPLQVKGL